MYYYYYYYYYYYCYFTTTIPAYRSQWPRSLRRRSAAARLLRLWVRIPPRAWMSFCCECCVLSDIGLCDELITRPKESYRLCCVGCVWYRKPREWRVPGPLGAVAPKKKKVPYLLVICWFLRQAVTHNELINLIPFVLLPPDSYLDTVCNSVHGCAVICRSINMRLKNAAIPKDLSQEPLCRIWF